VLAFAFTKNQFAQLESQGRLSSGGIEIATLDVDVMALCLARKVSVVDLGAFISESEIDDNQARAVKICDELSESLQSSLSDCHRALSYHMAHDLIFTLAYCLHVHVMTTNLVLTRRPDSALCFSENTVPFFWDPPAIPPDLGNGIVRGILESHGVSHQLFTCTPISDRDEVPADQVHVWMDTFSSPLHPAPWVSITQGLGYNEQSELFRGHEEERAELLQPVSYAWMNYIPFKEYYSDSQMSGFVQDARRNVRDKNQDDALWDSPYLECLWQGWRGMMTTCLHYYYYGKLICDALQPRVVIVGYDTRGLHRCFSEAAVECGAQPISIFHGGISNINNEGIRHRRAVGHLAVWSDRDIRYIREYRSSQYQLAAIGSLRTDVDRSFKKMGQASGNKISNPDGPCVVFLTCMVTGSYFLDISGERHVATWRSLLGYCRRRTDMQFIIKIHPRFDHSALYSDSSTAQPANLRIEVGSLSDALSRADIVVLVNAETTAVVDAIGDNLPVIFLNTAIRNRVDDWIHESGVLVVENVTAMEHQIDRILTDNAARSELVTTIQANMGNYLAATGQDAALRFQNFVRGVAHSSEGAGKTVVSKNHRSALWCLNIARQVDQLFLQPGSKPEGSSQLNLDAESNDDFYVDMLLMPKIIIPRVTWYRWSFPPKSFFATMMKLHRMFPASVRPSFGWVRPYLAQSLIFDAANQHRNRWSRLLSRCMALLLSPGRIRTMRS